MESSLPPTSLGVTGRAPPTAARRIAFLLGDLQPHDGVADYTRLLAGALADSGNPCLLIALNDRHVSHTTSETDSAARTAVVRLPGALSWRARMQQAAAALAAFSPDWVSWQFVAYSYNPKGIIAKEGPLLARLMAPYRVQALVHELWVGDYPDRRPTNRLLRPLQRHYVLRALRAARPRLIHTTTEIWRLRLAEARIDARILPLFGNVPVQQAGAADWLDAPLAAAGVNPQQRDTWWLFGIFGAIYANWPAERLLGRLQALATTHGRRTAVVSFGRIGDDTRFQSWKRAFPATAFVALGEQPAERISQVLNSIDFGLAATPFCLLEKSGAAAAMIEHGVPVIANHGYPRRKDTAITAPPLVFRADQDLEELLAKPPVRQPRGSSIGAVARQLLTDLAAAERGTYPAAISASRAT